MIPANHIVAVATALADAVAPPMSLHRLAELCPRALPGCRAATVARWKDGGAVQVATTGDDVADLLASQLKRGAGPAVEAVEAGFAWCPDTRFECRWPGFRPDALRLGVRGVVTLARHGGTQDGAETVTVTSYGVRPQRPALDTAALAWLFAADPGDAGFPLAAPSAGQAQSEAVALLRRALNTGETNARALLRAIARSRRCASEDAARWLVAEHARIASRMQEPRATGPGLPRHRQPPPVPRRRAPAPDDVTRSGSPVAAVERAAQLRRRLASLASSLGREEARLAKSLRWSAEQLPEHADELSAKASAARRYSRRAHQLARSFGDPAQADKADN
jgi:hypothetical protein